MVPERKIFFPPLFDSDRNILRLVYRYGVMIIFAEESFVLGKYARTADVLSLNWLPIKEQREWNTLKVTYKALHDANWPNYLKLQLVNHSRVLRSSSGSQIQVPLIKNILQDQSANLYNDLSIEIRNCNDYKVFCKETKNFLVLKAWSRLD